MIKISLSGADSVCSISAAAIKTVSLPDKVIMSLSIYIDILSRALDCVCVHVWNAKIRDNLLVIKYSGNVDEKV